MKSKTKDVGWAGNYRGRPVCQQTARNIATIGMAILIAAGCSRIVPDPDSEGRKVQRAVYSSEFEDVWRSAIQSAELLNWRLTFTDRDAGQIRAQTPRHMGAMGDELRVQISPSSRGVEVVVRGNYSWEPNRENVAAFLNEIRHRL